jgi:opacity protein-like surface antigen
MKTRNLCLMALAAALLATAFAACKDDAGSPFSDVPSEFQGNYIGTGAFQYLKVNANSAQYGANSATLTTVDGVSIAGADSGNGYEWAFIYVDGECFGLVVKVSTGTTIYLGSSARPVASSFSAAGIDVPDISGDAPSFSGGKQ